MAGILLAQATATAGSYDVWAFRAHPDVWLLMGLIGAGYWWSIHRLGPRVVRPGEPVATAAQRRWFWLGLLTMWVASDWPLHDLADSSLYSAHMTQHLVLSMLVPPMLLAGTPTWLARALLDAAGLTRLVRRYARPVAAAVIFNGVVVLSHWPGYVDLSVRSGLFHFGAHVLLMAASLLMWLPVVGPLPELRIRRTTAMLYLFMQSIIPTVPAGWLTFADAAVYEAYVTMPKAWGVNVLSDQQAAGLIMKLGGGFYLWGWITVLFFRWSAEHDKAVEGSYRRRPPADDGPAGPPAEQLPEGDRTPLLTTADVERQLADAGPAPRDPTGP